MSGIETANPPGLVSWLTDDISLVTLAEFGSIGLRSVTSAASIGLKFSEADAEAIAAALLDHVAYLRARQAEATARTVAEEAA